MIRIGSLNLRAYFATQAQHPRDLLTLAASKDCDVLLLQECRRSWFDLLKEATGMQVVFSQHCDPEVPRRAFPPDGCAIAVKRGFEVVSRRRIPPKAFGWEVLEAAYREPKPLDFGSMPERLALRYSARSVLAEVRSDQGSFTAASFHATPGTGTVGRVKVHERKPLFYGAVAQEMTTIAEPFVFGIDANEPLKESIDSVGFHWGEDRSGVKKMHALLGLNPVHRGRDLFRDDFGAEREPTSDELLAATYRGKNFERRFDSMWATPDFKLQRFETILDQVIEAGGDHAMLVADLTLEPTS
ncbi:endonuclease/exonuclease/phosphatase family protein [Thermoleophilia bacterium SCSIO 60948]|nr:endonuclease/exonuclease/phosphatase family protein [Thermoleophilia bacterium SCSIO 60948]